MNALDLRSMNWIFLLQIWWKYIIRARKMPQSLTSPAHKKVVNGEYLDQHCGRL